jgi:signal transduction histidine kinase/ligand-binding sensor domain-containing protein
MINRLAATDLIRCWLAWAMALALCLPLTAPDSSAAATKPVQRASIPAATPPATPQDAEFGFAEPHFSNVGDFDSVPGGIITALAQDKRGWLWIGTQRGLVRFDGYRFRLFVHDSSDPASLAGDNITALWAAPDGRLWIGTYSDGLSILDPEREQFSHLRHEPAQPASLANGMVWAFAGDAAGGLWIGTNDGLDYAAPGTGALQHFRHDRANPASLANNRVRSLLLDRDGLLWIGSSAGLQRHRPGTQEFMRIESDPANPDSLAGQEIRSMFQARDGKLWLGTRENGAAWLETKPETMAGQPRLHRILPDPQRTDRLSHGWIHSIAQPKPDQIWLGTYGGGINILAAQDGRVLQRVRHDPGTSGSLALDDISPMLVERSGLLWIGTWGAGLQQHNTQNQALRMIRQRRPNGLSYADVSSVLELQDGRILVGSGGNGIDILDRRRGLIGAYRPQTVAGGELADGNIRALAQTPDGTLWVGTRQAGVQRLTPGSTRWQSLAIAQGLPDNNVNQFMQTRDATLLVGTNGGVARWDNGQQRFVALRQANGHAMLSAVKTMAEDSGKRLWFGSNDGLWLLLPGAPGLTVVHSDGQPGSLISDDVCGLLPDGDGMWLATGKGLARLQKWDGQRPQFEVINPPGSKPGRDLGANLLQDRQGRVWTGDVVYDPKTQILREPGKADGFDIGGNWRGAYATTRDGLFLYGGPQGLAVIDPAQFTPWTYQPTLAVTELKVDGKLMPPAMFSHGLTLAPGQRSFSLEFSALDYSAPKANRYAHRLQGYDADWINSDSEHRSANYGNLWPGHYVLEVRGSNRAGEWSPQQLRIPVEILPAFWQRGWFVTLLVLLVAGSVWGGYHWRIVRMQAKAQARAQALQAMVEQRTAEALAAHSKAEAAHDQLAMAQQLAEARQQMLQQEKMAALGMLTAGVAHEINNPTNFTHVAAQIQRTDLDKFEQFLNALMADDPDPELMAEFAKHFDQLRANVAIMLEGTGRIQGIIKDLRAFSRRDQAEKKSLHLSECLASTLNLVRINWSNQVEFITEFVDDPLYECWPALLNQVFMNLMVNGCHAIASKRQASAKSGEAGAGADAPRGHLWLRLRVQTDVQPPMLVVEIEDDGCGIEAHVRERILEPFFTTKDADTGTGLGLSIANGIILKHNGSLSIASTPGVGSCFAVHLPLEESESVASEPMPPQAVA